MTKPPVSLELDSPELAATYDATSVHQLKHGIELVAALGVKAGERVLDVGCGTGRLGEHVARLVEPDGAAFGIDPLPLRIEIAARKHPRFHARVGRAEDLSDFADAQFDVVFANSVFHWVEDPLRALREAYRVLAPGGRIGVNSADAERPHQSAVLFRDALIAAGIAGAQQVNTHGPPRRLSADRLRSLLTAAGFHDLRIERQVAVDEVSGVDEYIAWMKSSTFGNFLLDLSSTEQERARAVLRDQLEPLRGATGIRLERYLVVGFARR
ncbi:MAG TPA: methyltransferase domain-containing protein [Polyangiales bacterium]|nr:methyltransferase domain-containing protein [Polyangiales bacterium]